MWRYATTTGECRREVNKSVHHTTHIAQCYTSAESDNLLSLTQATIQLLHIEKSREFRPAWATEGFPASQAAPGGGYGSHQLG